jgi:hypothetical protein
VRCGAADCMCSSHLQKCERCAGQGRPPTAVTNAWAAAAGVVASGQRTVRPASAVCMWRQQKRDRQILTVVRGQRGSVQFGSVSGLQGVCGPQRVVHHLWQAGGSSGGLVNVTPAVCVCVPPHAVWQAQPLRLACVRLQCVRVPFQDGSERHTAAAVVTPALSPHGVQVSLRCSVQTDPLTRAELTLTPVLWRCMLPSYLHITVHSCPPILHSPQCVCG